MAIYNEQPPDRRINVLKFTKLGLVIVAIVGTMIFYVYQFDVLGGLGLALALFGLASFFHFNKRKETVVELMDTKISWFLIGMTFIGLFLVLANYTIKGPAFYNGIGIGMTLICAISYCVELLLTWSDSVSKK